MPAPPRARAELGRETRWYHFRGRAGRWELERERSLARDLPAALRAGISLVGTLHFRWSSGASGGFWLGVEGGSGARWVQSALRTLYDPGQWPRAETLPSGTVVAEVGRTAGLLGAPILPVSPDMALSDALWRGFRAAGAGAWLEGWATPCPMPAHPPPLLARPMEPMPASERDRVSPADDPERRLRNRIEERRQEPHWAVRLVVARDLAAPATAAQALGRLTAALLRFPGGAAVDFRAPRRWGSSRPPPVLDFAVSELAALLPAPWAVGDQGAREGEGSLAIAVGRSDGGAVAKLPIPPREGRHLLVLGETGTGKSSSLLRLARSAATRGSLVLFDPVGDTAERFSQVLPSPLARRVRWIGPDDPGSGTNALADIGGRRDAVQRERSTASLVNAFRQLRLARFPDTAFWGPRIEEHLAAALRAAAASPGATLVEAYELLDSGASGFSGWSAEGRQAVAEFDRWSRERREDGEGAQRLLGEIIRDPILRRLLCASPPDWSTDGLFAAGSITVFRGQAAEVGEPTARALLGTYLALLWRALLASPVTGKRFLVLDEIQWYAHEGLAELLRLGRRYNVHVYAATQSLASLSESVQEPLRTNVADYLLFRGDPREIREWSRWLPSVSAERLLALPQGHALFLEGKGVRVEWIRTVPPIHRPPVPTRPLTPTDGELSEGLRPDHPGPLPPHSAAPAPNDAPESTWTDLLEPAGPGLVRLRHRLLAERLGWQVAQIRRLGASLRRQGRLCRGDRDLGERSWLIRCETGPKAADRSGPEPERTPPDERGAPTE